MAESRFLLVRLGSLGDIVHALPAASALREAFPNAEIDWLVEPKWERILESNRDLNEVITLDRANLTTIRDTVKALRSRDYMCAIDFQGLYKSALMPFAARVPRRIGFRESYAREGLASKLYTETHNPVGAHKVDHNLTLVHVAGAAEGPAKFPISIFDEDRDAAAEALGKHNLVEYFVLNPGGGWKSKCWPAERYGELSNMLAQKYGWRALVTYGPGEDDLAQQALLSARGTAVAIPLALGPLMAVLKGAKFVVSADTGPLHLASALGAPCIGLYGPTDPARNGPYSRDDLTVRNLRGVETTYGRGGTHAPSMLSITAEQVAVAVDERLRRIA